MAITSGQLAYYGRTTKAFKPIRAAHNFKRKKDKIALLWGDPLYVFDIVGSNARVSAKGHHLSIPVADLMDTPLLSIYQIDCGQGDAALVHFPDDRWMMVDGGPPHDWSNSGKIAADFLYWKMFVDQSWKNEFDFNRVAFRIDALVCTHPDYDHYGGFLDMTKKVRDGVLEYGTVYHCGLGRFGGKAATAYAAGSGFGQLGPVRGDAWPEVWVTTLIDGFDDVRKYRKGAGARRWKLAGSYGKWLNELEELHGIGVDSMARVDASMGTLPGFGPGAAATVRVLGPVVETWRNKPALRYLDTAGASSMKAPSKTRNGHSVVLRIDYGDVRVLLTGDLNFKSQALLLKHIPTPEFRCHIAKGCHHGSEDVSWTFIQAMSPVATMISSGDNEAYAHPRAKVLGLTGAFASLRSRGKPLKYLGLEEERYVAPLIYSTELSRSIALYPPYAVFDNKGVRVDAPDVQAEGRVKRSEGRREALADWLLGDRMVYGLINVRTDGERIVVGVLKEDESAFQVEELRV